MSPQHLNDLKDREAEHNLQSFSAATQNISYINENWVPFKWVYEEFTALGNYLSVNIDGF